MNSSAIWEIIALSHALEEIAIYRSSHVNINNELITEDTS